ncbi:MAG: hypothetical protein EPO36_05435 [Chloroflexota bacterium]|nr:MAG: hypothetical protein EPO36_05435 [Chloroflexota bacterium]
MATRAYLRQPGLEIPRPELHLAGKLSVIFLGLLGLGAVAGGIALTSKPDGSVMHFDVAILGGSPFTDFFVPGLILGGLFGIGSFVVAALGLRHARIAPFLAFAVGCGQMIWIVIELTIIGEFSFLHPTFFGVGLVIALAAVPWGWPTFQAWRRSR